MRRPDTALDPIVAEDLDRLEAALAGEPGADPGVAELVRDVRAEAPGMTPAFRARLDERVAHGFPRERRRRVWRPRRTALLPALSAATVLLVGLAVIGLAGRGGGHHDGAVTSNSAGATAARQPQPATGEALAPQAKTPTGAAPTAPTTPPPVADAGGRKVERAAQLTLTTSPGNVQAVADGVVRTTQALGGYVETSQVTTSGREGSATLQLRIPSARMDDALGRLGALAHVGSLSQSATDITRPVRDAADRHAEARAERRALLRALGSASSEREIASLRERLRLNRSRIAQLNGELAALRRRANLATVDVAVQGVRRGDGGGVAGGGPWTPADALRDALRVLEVAAGVIVVALAVLVPLALLGAPAALVGRALRRRRREAALDVV